MGNKNKTYPGIAALFLAVFAFGACSPTVKMEPPDKPIEINLNIKIEQEVRVKIDKELDNMFEAEPDIFGTGNEEG